MATATEIYDYLRLLYARIGRTYCPQCGEEVKKDTVDEVAERILALGEGTRVQVLSSRCSRRRSRCRPAKAKRSRAAGKQEEAAKPARRDDSCSTSVSSNCASAASTGCIRMASSSSSPPPSRCWTSNFAEPVFMLLDRIAVSPDARSRIVDAVESGYREAGEVVFETAPREGESRSDCASRSASSASSATFKYEQPEPRLFSFNNPYGACPRCQGFGNTIDFDMNLVIPDQDDDPGRRRNRALDQAEVQAAGAPRCGAMRALAGIPLDVPWARSRAEQQQLIMEGDGKFSGVRGFFEHLERKKYKLHVRVFLSRYRGYSRVRRLRRARLRREARQVKIAGKDICQVSAHDRGAGGALLLAS